METKVCRACLEEKEVREFYKDSKNKDKLAIRCKVCINNRIKIIREHPAKDNLKICKKCNIEKEVSNFYSCATCFDKYQGNCKMCSKEYTSSDYIKTTDIKKCIKCELELSYLLFSKNKRSRDGYTNTCKKCVKKANKKWREANKEYIKQEKKNYYNKNKEHVIRKSSEYHLNKLNNNPIYKLISRTRTLIGNSFKRGCEKSFKKPQKSENILGCTMQEFVEHLQSLFTEGMTLENHGNCEECWHIDHIVPISSAKTEEDVIKLNHYSNLQPLWRRDNLTKSKKYE